MLGGGKSLFPDSPSGNSVTVNGDVPNSGSAYGGYIVVLSDNNPAEVANNRISVTSGSVGDVYGGAAVIENGSGATSATGNSVIISGGSIGHNVQGGYVKSYSGPATATGNRVSISGGRFGGYVYGGYANSGSDLATATGNRVSISGGSFRSGINRGDVYGGYAYSFSGPATATNNRVSISGGSIGGYAKSDAPSPVTIETGNTVTLSGSPVFAGSSEIFGGSKLATRNTLNLWNYTGSSVFKVQKFQYYNFVLPVSLQASSTGSIAFDPTSEVTGVSIMGGGGVPQAGDVLTLINFGAITGNIVNDGAIISGKKGVSLLYDFHLAQGANALTATIVGGPSLNPQTKALSEGRLAGVAFVNQGGDLAAGYGLDAAQNAATGTSGFAPFFAAQGGTSRYNTGSHVDVDGFSLMTGLAWNGQTEYGALLLGAFLETGWGNYDSHNSFSGFASVKGEGDTKYYGGGILGRFDFAPTGPGNIYAETSFRAGWAETDFSSGDLRDGTGDRADYDSGSAYYGAHLGLGYLWNITDASSLDVYTKYFWTHQDSDNVSVVGDPVKFNSTDSHRWRGGARFACTMLSESGLSFTPYIGAAYEHEFDGKAEASVYGYSIDAPDLKGGTGIGELGLSFKPSADSGLSLDLGVQGYTGVREGVTGSFQLRFEF